MADAIKIAEENAKKFKKKKQKKNNDNTMDPLTGSRKLSPKGRKVYWLELHDFLHLIQDLKLINSDFSIKDGKRCFFLSRAMSKDESKYLLIRKTLNYPNFLECICRLVDHLQVPTNEVLEANEVVTLKELVVKKQIEHAVGDDTLDGWISVNQHKVWSPRKPMTGSLANRLSIVLPFLIDQIKNSIAVGKVRSVEKAKKEKERK
jgi:hypothetical protein